MTNHLGWHTRSGRWASLHDASDPDWIPLPTQLREVCVTDPHELECAASDLGHQYRQPPGVLLRPETAQDVAEAVKFARRHGVPGVVARGTTHATGGQALAPDAGALYLDMRALNHVQVDDTHIAVGAGATLRQAAEAAWGEGKRLASGVTGYTGLSIGGLLSVGGISLDHGVGTIGDYADEVDLVDGSGRLITCSAHRYATLHRLVRGGLGQFGIIVGARLRLAKAKPYASQHILRVAGHHTMLRITRSLIRRGELDSVYARRRGADLDTWEVLATAYHRRDEDPMPQMLRGMPESQAGDPVPYLRNILSHDIDLYDPLIEQGWDELPKRWWDWFLADNQIGGFLDEVAATEPGDLYGDAAVALVIPKPRGAIDTRLALPEASGRDGELVWLVDGLLDPGLRFTGSYQSWALRAETWIQQLTAAAGRHGATVYHIGNVKHSREQHYGHDHTHVAAARAEYDPAGLFGRGLWRDQHSAPSESVH